MSTNLIDRFIITKDNFFELLIPQNKDNYYYQPTDKLHKFDIVTLIYQSNHGKIIILNDALGLIVSVLHYGLLDALENKRPLPIEIKKGEVSLSFSINSDKEHKKINYSNLWLWSSTSEIQVWLYNNADKIYLEISYTYPWLSSDPEPSDAYATLDEYEKSYKPIALYEISKITAKKWQEQCVVILKNIEDYEINK